MGVVIGHGGAIALGVESTYGTAVSRTEFLRIVSLAGWTKTVERSRRSHSKGPGNTDGGMPIAHDDGRIQVSGLQVTVQLFYDDIEPWYLLYAAMGAAAKSGAGPYVHTLTLDKSLPSYTIESVEGEDKAGDDAAVVASGAMCNEWALTIPVSPEPATLETTWICRNDAGDVTSTTSPTYGAGTTPVMYHQVSDITWNSITIDKSVLRTLILRGLNGLVADRFGYGSQLMSEPQLGDQRSVTLEIEMERDQAEALRASYVSSADTDLTFSVTSSPHSVAFTLVNAIITTLTRTWSVNGIVMQSVTFEARAVTGGGNGLQVVVTNSINQTIGS